MIGAAWAQGGSGGAAPSALIQMAPLLLVFVVFYFLLIRPQQLKQKQHNTMLANLKRNDRVVTSGGLHGKIVDLADTAVTLEIAPNVRVKVERQQIATVMGAKTNGDGKEGKDKEKDKES
jgi:preprotein translocase subunit YajC